MLPETAAREGGRFHIPSVSTTIAVTSYGGVAAACASSSICFPLTTPSPMDVAPAGSMSLPDCHTSCATGGGTDILYFHQSLRSFVEADQPDPVPRLHNANKSIGRLTQLLHLSRGVTGIVIHTAGTIKHEHHRGAGTRDGVGDDVDNLRLARLGAANGYASTGGITRIR